MESYKTLGVDVDDHFREVANGSEIDCLQYDNVSLIDQRLAYSCFMVFFFKILLSYQIIIVHLQCNPFIH